MSRFYANIDGAAKTSATRTGNKISGISGHIRGWDLGVLVTGYIDTDGEDVFCVYRTGGSSVKRPSELLLKLKGKTTILKKRISELEMEIVNVVNQTSNPTRKLII